MKEVDFCKWKKLYEVENDTTGYRVIMGKKLYDLHIKEKYRVFLKKKKKSK